MNVYDGEWEQTPYATPPGWEQRTKRLLPPGRDLGMSLYELPPGQTQVVYHFHHAWEELLVVLHGQPTLRTPAGERRLAEGEAVHFPVGPDGAHGLKNETDERVRILMASTLSSPEVAEYPDLGQITAQARTGSQTGERLWVIHDVDPKRKEGA